MKIDSNGNNKRDRLFNLFWKGVIFKLRYTCLQTIKEQMMRNIIKNNSNKKHIIIKLKWYKILSDNLISMIKLIDSVAYQSEIIFLDAR